MYINARIPLKSKNILVQVVDLACDPSLAEIKANALNKLGAVRPNTEKKKKEKTEPTHLVWLAQVYELQKDWTSARNSYEKCCSIFNSMYGVNNKYSATVLYNVGKVGRRAYPVRTGLTNLFPPPCLVVGQDGPAHRCAHHFSSSGRNFYFGVRCYKLVRGWLDEQLCLVLRWLGSIATSRKRVSVLSPDL